MVLLIIFLMLGMPLKAEMNIEEPADESEVMPEAEHPEGSLPPTLAVYFHETARRNLPASPENIKEEISSISAREVTRDSELYIREDTQAILKIQTDVFDADRVKVTIYEEDYQSRTRKDVTSEYYSAEKWTGSRDDSFYCPVLFRQEGHYQLEITWLDSGGRMLEPALESQGGCFSEGTYISPHLTVDKKTPVIVSMSTDSVPCNMQGEVACFEENPEYELIVEEENFHPSDFRWKKDGQMIVMSDWEVFYENGTRKNRVSFCTKEEGFYSLTYEIRDGSGRNCSGDVSFLVDRTSPEIKIHPDFSSGCFRYPYEDISLISGNPMTFTLAASDVGSGIRSIRYSFRNKDGMVEDGAKDIEGAEKDYLWKIALPREDFCGWLTVSCTDCLGHGSESITSPVFLWESRQMFDTRKSLKISYSEPEYTDEENRIKYYKETALIRVDGGNDYAGVKESQLRVVYGKEDRGESWDYDSSKKITSVFHQEIRLSPEDYEESCKEKSVSVLAAFKDNAGYETGKKKGKYGIVIDHLAPVITLDFQDDGQEGPYQGGTYYNRVRSAIVTVTDWNFDPSSARWHISGKKGGYSLGSWHGNGKKHWCKIDFQSDGTYRVGLTVSDYSGNTASFKSGDEFTVDRTPPELLLWMDSGKACNKKYYSGTVMVYILLKEENGSRKQIHFYTGKGTEGKISQVHSPALPFLRENKKRGWKIYSYAALKEGTYHISCHCQDKAGNRSAKKTIAPFVVDKTPPEIEWHNLRDGITYTGKVMPRISVSDQNLDDSLCRLDLCYGNGAKAVKLESYMVMTGERHKKKTFHWRDFPKEKKYDNRYLLRISVCDLAGNKPADREIAFYVDRFGARYQLPEETERYLENYYHNQEQDILVTAFSLHPLQTDVLINYNNEDFYTVGPEDCKEQIEILTDRGEGEYHQILPAIHQGWYQTTYTIAKRVFEEEGNYSIALRSREMSDTLRSGEPGENGVDMAEDSRFLTESETILWTAPIEFVIDKTPPSVIIGGLDQETYKADRKEYTITALDNMRLKKVRLSVRKEEEGRGKTILLTEKDFSDNHSISSELKAYNGYQILGYDAWDYAGNKISTRGMPQEKKVLVTGSALFHFYHRHRAGLAVCTLFLFSLSVSGILLTRKYFFDIVKKIFFS